ncbi:copper resistance protein B [Acinetobacter piscicola]|uniref:copper resistance protein B n=1 Tax=Acinetobacter piscicola TaxID=2006115 RepID=UPI000B7D2E22|nr:copper resistance protein B [Acinetobacter piscicola]
MHITNLFPKTFPKTLLASSLLLLCGVAFAHEGHADISPQQLSEQQHDMSEMDHSKMNHDDMQPMDRSKMMHHTMPTVSSKNAVKVDDSIEQYSLDKMDHSQHPSSQTQYAQTEYSQTKHSQTKKMAENHQGHDHRTEHGAQIYAVTTVDNKWLVNEDGKGALKSEFETRIGTDENKIFIKAHVDKHESHDAEYDVKALYSRMISDFWDAQIGTRYRVEKVELDQHRKDTEEKLDAVIGLHGMVPYFFETDAYFYAGEDHYAGFSLETERDLLFTQKLIVKPYLDLDIIFSDDSKYAKKSGLSNVTAGLETRYEISKKVMPYLDIAYEYSKGNDSTAWQLESDSEKGWLYGAGIRFKF